MADQRMIARLARLEAAVPRAREHPLDLSSLSVDDLETLELGYDEAGIIRPEMIPADLMQRLCEICDGNLGGKVGGHATEPLSSEI